MPLSFSQPIRAQRRKALTACLCAMLLAFPVTPFAKDTAIKPGLHFYLNTKGSFGCFSKNALIEHVQHLKMGNGPKAKQLQVDDLEAAGSQCYTLFLGERLLKADYVVVTLESINGIDGRVVGYSFLDNPKNPPSFYTLIKYVTPAQTDKSTDAK